MIETGDTSGLGWATVLLYGVAALTTLGCAVRAEGRSDRLFWTILCLACVGLGANKQADIQTDLIAAGRWIVTELGLYEQRRAVQLVIFAGLAVGAGLFARTVMRLRPAGGGATLAVAGLATVLLYVCLRAAAASHVFDKHTALVAIHLIEPLGLALTAAGAVSWLRRPRP